ncbi:DUF2194 domain-containing protein [Aliifodinibius sp. S!AR15-10]|uniref:DUF2194 domain-containing protein n=1 Tax=Aliifodinibius sp. S!AR15-10 TaxID=2950437 RepID=UPI002865337F|nr:DUF2194 domain-containing protein [Aliifodinibius sp. S!AR15-10]MDR8389775.1 DUF2194 domain-containing protein [Aliifodinibius sp. S!AR15-10]
MISHRADTVSQEITGQLAQALDYAKIRYQVQDLSRDSTFDIPLTAQTVLLTTGQLQQVDSLEIERLLRFVNDGNNLIIPRPVWDSRLMYLQGMHPNTMLQEDTTATGFLFRQEVFPGFQGVEDTLVTQSAHQGFSPAVFKENVSVIATAQNRNGYPVILQNSVGAGSVYVYNSYMFSGRDYRGLLFSNVLRTLPGVPYEVGNISTIFLDDFPAPVYNEMMEPIATEYGITQAQFVYDVWWPDMKKLADSLNITYTAMLVYNYNSKMVPPFTFEQWKLGTVEAGGDSVFVTPTLAKDVLASRHELAFHGYNHYSLLMENWRHQRYMTSSLEASKRMWFVQQLGDSPITYVPPHNYIDSAGIKSLTKGMPSLRYLASLSTGDLADGGAREFGPDPYNPYFYDYPRQTSGFKKSNNSRFLQHSHLLITGIWNHFVHPDDVFDIGNGNDMYEEFGTRNPNRLGWRDGLGGGEHGFYDLFKNRVVETKASYPMLRFEAARTAVPKVQAYRNRSYQRSITEQQFVTRQIDEKGRVANSATSRYWFMYVPEYYVDQTEQKLEEIGAEFTRTTLWNGYLYQFAASALVLSFPQMDPGERGVENRLTVDQLTQEIQNFQAVQSLTANPGIEYTPEALDSLEQAFARNPKSVELRDQVIRVSLGTNNTDKAIDLLEDEVLVSQNMDPMSVERLLTFYGWQNRAMDAWRLLENRWRINPTPATLDLNNKVVEEFGWPDIQTELKWLRREYHTYPDSTQIIRNVVTSFTADTSWNSITKGALDRLIAQNPQSDTLYAYKLQRSFWYDSTETTLKIVDELPPYAHAQLRPFADDLAFIYADTRQDTVTAEQWASRAFHFDPTTRLQWMLDRGELDRFHSQSLQILRKYPEVDSLRTFIGGALFYEGYTPEAYDILYPLLFDNRKDSVEYDLEAEMGYLTYDQQMEMYREYPAMFTDSLRRDLNRRYQTRESFSVVAQASHQDDNFNNQVTRIGLGAEWGNTTGNLHRINLSDIFVGSTVNEQDLSGQLYQADYSFTHTFPSQQLQAHAGAGAQYRTSDTFPYISAGISYYDSLSFNSLELQYQSVLTNTGIEQNIKELEATLYREDTWLDGLLRTAVSGRGRYFTDNVFAYEGGLTLFLWPQTLGNFSATPVATGFYGSATESRNSGVPYFTPDNLITRGGGLNLAYQEPTSNIDIQLQLQANRDNDTGLFYSANTTVSTPITRNLNLQLQASLSNSEIYRSNNIGFTLHFDFPKKLPSPVRRAPTFYAGTSMNLPNKDLSRYGNVPANNRREDYKIIGTLSYPGTTAYTSLYDHTIRYKKIGEREEGAVRSYFTGDFIIEDLSPGRYQLWLPETDGMEQVKPDTMTVDLTSNLENRVFTNANFNLHPELPPVPEPLTAQDTLQYYVVLNYSDSLSQAISLIERDEPRLKESLSLYYDYSRSLIQIGSRSFGEREEAVAFYNLASQRLEGTPFGIETIALADTAVTEMTYRFQFGSFRKLNNAQAFLNLLATGNPELDLAINVDPFLGLFKISTSEYTDWRQSGFRLREIKNVLGDDQVFRDIQPNISP